MVPPPTVDPYIDDSDPIVAEDAMGWGTVWSQKTARVPDNSWASVCMKTRIFIPVGWSTTTLARSILTLSVRQHEKPRLALPRLRAQN